MGESAHLPGWLDSVASKMLADFEASARIAHNASKGTVRESDLRLPYLSKYLPGTVRALGSSEVVDSHGEISQQCDITVVEPSTPPLWDKDDYRVVPAECVYGAIEVKSNLTTDELRRAWSVSRSVKVLKKEAFYDPALSYQRMAYGVQWNYIPTAGIVFAYDGATLETLGQAMAELAAAEHELPLRVDSVWVLNRGYLVWRDLDTGMFDGQPVGTHNALVAVEATPGQVLVTLTAHLHRIFATAFMPPFNVTPYLSGKWGKTVKTWEPDPAPMT